MSLYDASKKSDECFLITRYVSRWLSYPVALFFRKLGFTANAVTILGGSCWVASIPVFMWSGWLLRNGDAGRALLALAATAVLWNLGYILDVADGSLARMNGTQGAKTPHPGSNLNPYMKDIDHHVLRCVFSFATSCAIRSPYG